MSEEGFDNILVYVARITKFAYFIPAKSTDTAQETAKRLFAAIFCVHGPPKVIISDRDKTLTAEIFKNLMKMMNIQQLMGTSYEHRYNGAVEVLNKTIEVMLRHVMSDNMDVDFVSVLPLAQYCSL